MIGGIACNVLQSWRGAGAATGRAVTLCLAGIACALTVATAGAAPLAIDIQLDIGAANQRGPNPTIVANGATVTVTRLSFIAGTGVELITPLPASARVRFELAPGLRFGANPPSPTEGCTATGLVAECQSPELQPIVGRTGWGWEWDVIAEREGSYVLRSEIVSASDSDPDPSNNSASITVVVTQTQPQPAPQPSPQPSPSVATSGVRLSPPMPRAGSAVSASVRVTAGGAPVRPTQIVCTGSIGGRKLQGSGRAAAGIAACTYRPPRSAKGKQLRGSVRFTARGQRLTKRFSARLR